MLVFAAVLPAQSRTSAHPGLDADPRAREYSRRNLEGPNGWQNLAEIALWASGADVRGPLKDRIIAAGRGLASAPDLPSDLRERGDFILNFLYERYLKRYSANQTRLDEIFVSGRYNCVSSAALYAIFASAAGMDVRGVMTKDHAFASVNVGTEFIDVETTNPYGFDPGSRREFHDDFGQVTGFAYVPARNYRDRVSISPLELVSLIFTNRIADLEKQGRYRESLPLALDRAVLLANRTNPVSSPFFSDPRADLMDRIFNYGASLLNGGREADALSWAAMAEPRYPGDPRWQELYFSALNNQIVKLLRAKQIPEARNVLDRYRSRLAPEKREVLDTLVLDADLTSRANQIGTAAEAAALLHLIDSSDPRLLPAARAEELRTFVILQEGKRLASAEGSQAAIAYTAGAIEKYGTNSNLNNALRIYRQNRVADLHNHFADLFNRRDFTAARRAIQAALEEFPGNRQLQTDLERVEQALKSR